MPTVFLWLTHYGYPVLFSLLVLGIVGLPVPDETLLTFCGYLIYKGRLEFGLTLLTAFCGSAGGITLSYLLGARFGRTVLTRFGPRIHLTPRRLQDIEGHFKRLGPPLLTVGYFIPGVRHLTAVVAGLSRLPWVRFAIFAYGGAAIWAATFLTLGYAFGEQWQHTSAVAQRYIMIGCAFLALVLLVLWAVRRLKKCFSIQK